MKRLKKFNPTIQRCLIDFIPAFLGVLVALLLNEWKENKKENEFITNSIISIYKDNKINLERISSQITLLERQCDTLFKYVSDKDMSILDIVRKSNGFHTREFTQISWKILVNSQLANKIHYHLLIQLTSLSKEIETVDASIEKITTIIYNQAESKSSNNKYRLYIIEKDLLVTSKKLHEKAIILDSMIISQYKNKIDLKNLPK